MDRPTKPTTPWEPEEYYALHPHQPTPRIHLDDNDEISQWWMKDLPMDELPEEFRRMRMESENMKRKVATNPDGIRARFPDQFMPTLGFTSREKPFHIHGRFDDGYPWPEFQEHLEERLQQHPNYIPGVPLTPQIIRRPFREGQVQELGTLNTSPYLRVDPTTAALVILITHLERHERKQKLKEFKDRAPWFDSGRKEPEEEPLGPLFTLPQIRDDGTIDLRQQPPEWMRKYPWLVDPKGNLKVDPTHPLVRRALRRYYEMPMEERKEIAPYVRQMEESLKLELHTREIPTWLHEEAYYGGESKPSPLLTMSPEELNEEVTPEDFAEPEVPDDVDPEFWKEVRKELAWSPMWSGYPWRQRFRPAAVVDPETGLKVRPPEPVDLIDPRGHQRMKYWPLKSRYVGTFVSWRKPWERESGLKWSEPQPPNYPPEAPYLPYPPDIISNLIPLEEGYIGKDDPVLDKYLQEMQFSRYHARGGGQRFEQVDPEKYYEEIGPPRLLDLSQHDNLFQWDWRKPPPPEEFEELPLFMKGLVWVGFAALTAFAARGIGRRLMKAGKTRKRTFYEGGFESAMTKREAGLILNCRQNATREQVMDRYRVMMRLNHPDLGGSPFVSTKINEAKTLLMRGAISTKK